MLSQDARNLENLNWRFSRLIGGEKVAKQSPMTSCCFTQIGLHTCCSLGSTAVRRFVFLRLQQNAGDFCYRSWPKGCNYSKHLARAFSHQKVGRDWCPIHARIRHEILAVSNSANFSSRRMPSEKRERVQNSKLHRLQFGKSGALERETITYWRLLNAVELIETDWTATFERP